jgi:hypothetical protein
LLARIRFGVAVKARSFFRKKLISPLSTLWRATVMTTDHAVFVVVQLVIERIHVYLQNGGLLP